MDHPHLIVDYDGGHGREGEGIVATPTASPVTAIRYEVQSWLEAVDLQEQRVFGTTRTDAQIIDARLFVLAIRIFYRAAKSMVEAVGSEPLLSALAKFESRQPDIVTVRDVTEHFDDYLVGRGYHGKGLRRPTHSMTTGTRNHLIQVPKFGSDGALQKSFLVNVSAAAADAREFAAEILGP